MPEQINPESELLYAQIVRDRAFQRRRGILTTILWAVGTILYLWATLALWINGIGWLALVMLAISVFFGYQIMTGVKLYLWGKTPIAKDEIALRRQEERVYLFRAAHGQIPREWRLPSLLTKAALGLLFVGYSIWYMLHKGSQVGAPIFFASFGLSICVLTAFEWRRARRLKMESGAILAERLYAGENTEGIQEANEQEEM